MLAKNVSKGKKSQIYFWTSRWQAGEKRASEDIASSRVHSYSSTGDFFKDIVRKHKKQKQ